jgi:tRNA pseudouridine38-40 synthase
MTVSKSPFPASFKPGDRVAMALSYDGSAFRGWQSQRKPHVATVQEALEQSLTEIANTPIKVQCAGRTDACVHASHQIVHFDSPVERNEKAWVSGGNSHLPAGVSIQWAKPVPPTFHARFSATARRYRYLILNTPTRPALLANGVTWQSRSLNEPAMHEAAQALVGELDFSSYRAVACQSNTAMRNVHFVDVSRRGDLVIIDIEANAFLYHMVRNIAGALMSVGTGVKPIKWVKEVLLAKDRTVAAATAQPYGLYLVGVTYPGSFELPMPTSDPGPYFLASSH